MNLKRVRKLNTLYYSSGPIVYWMSRDQRASDNWALIYANMLAREKNTHLIVVFTLRKKFTYSTERMLHFMLTGLEEVERNLHEKNIPFVLLHGEPVEEVSRFVQKHTVGALVSDFSPLKYNITWKNDLSKKLSIPFFEVDAHNIVPVWTASTKQEFAAYTIRPKIRNHLNEFLDTYPSVDMQDRVKGFNKKNDWDSIYKNTQKDENVKKLDWIKPGELQAHKKLSEFIKLKLNSYADERNNPTLSAQSDLSPYLHFGHISSQKIALEVSKSHVNTKSREAFLEELIIRKELSDNYCLYNVNYDNPNGFPQWAQKTLSEHQTDKREHMYSFEELQYAKTHDELWNAAQLELIHRGKVHGYMRMYWAKKILEWTKNVSDAQRYAIQLNDTYMIDGRDPNGYTGIAWSLGGVHDRAWFDRPLFGKIRYMSYNGASSKFDIQSYISAMNLLANKK